MISSLHGTIKANVACREGRQRAANSKGDTEVELVCVPKLFYLIVGPEQESVIMFAAVF